MLSRGETRDSRHGPLRLLPGFLVFVLLASALVLLAPGLLSGLRGAGGSLVWNPECVVETPDGKVGLTREEAQRATTAVALLARGVQPPDTSGIDAAALEQLAAGPCRFSEHRSQPGEVATETGGSDAQSAQATGQARVRRSIRVRSFCLNAEKSCRSEVAAFT